MSPPTPSSSATTPVLQLAATGRLARSLREAHALARRQAGAQVWRTPHILSIDQWITDLWANQWPVEQLLSATQALALWLEAIESDRQNTLLAPLATAREALRAESLLLRWNIDVDDLYPLTEEQRAWLNWRRRVRKRMRQNDWLLNDDLPAIVAAALERGDVRLPACLQLHGFEGPPTPSLERLLNAAAAHTRLEYMPATKADAEPETATSRAARIEHLRAPDPISQIRQIALQVRQKLEAAGTELPPRIVIVVPDASKRRDLLEAALSEYLVSHSTTASSRLPWRWEAGRAATAWPWIAAAAAVFAIDAQDTDIDRISCLLLATPLWEGPSRAAAAALDYQLRRGGRSRVSLNALVARAGPEIKPRLQRLLESIRAEARRAPPSTWAQAMEARLAALGWPGESVLPSQAFQCVQELERRLARLGSMDSVVGTTDIAGARMWLGEILRASFEPRVEHVQPIAIVSPEEAIGLPCELLVICDASTDAFPGRTQQTPFLSPDAQRKAGIPEADPALHLERVRQTLRGMTANAAQVRVLVPAVDDNGAELQPSSLFDGEWLDTGATAPVSLAERLAAQPSPVILPEQDPVPPVSGQEHIHGDTRLFEKWAEAPFFAFCTHRLGLEALPQPARGLDARDQGTIIHDALRRIWEQIRTRDNLLALSPAELDELLRQALAPMFKRKLKEYQFGPALMRMERARMHDLLRQWMAHEKSRFDAFEVVACEQPLHAELAGLPLSLVIDRIDRIDTATGPRWLVLDYKTGRQADPKGWEADALRSPQLPLYATLASHADLGFQGVDGIGFAHLKDGHPAFSAATDWCNKLREPPTEPKRNWNERLAAWTAALENAARGFLAGNAGFDASALPERSLNAWLLPLTGTDDEDDDSEGESA